MNPQWRQCIPNRRMKVVGHRRHISLPHHHIIGFVGVTYTVHSGVMLCHGIQW